MTSSRGDIMFSQRFPGSQASKSDSSENDDPRNFFMLTNINGIRDEKRELKGTKNANLNRIERGVKKAIAFLQI